MVKQHNVQIVLLTLDCKTVVFGISLVLFTLTPDLSFEYLLSHVFAKNTTILQSVLTLKAQE